MTETTELSIRITPYELRSGCNIAVVVIRGHLPGQIVVSISGRHIQPNDDRTARLIASAVEEYFRNFPML